ncbi:MAG: Gfo/Idh/MocA family oxidoreductase [Dehalococcoidia bacterium]|nr:Gfo/Idh/MocA family oxidoreductase [Dehalococcoidia bacterium]
MAIGWGIVGLGGWADRYSTPAVRQAKDTKLVGVVSRDKAKAQKFAAYHGAQHAYDNLEDLLNNKEVDVVYVLTPNNLHAETAIPAMAKGKHVLVGSAMAVTEEDCIAMVEAGKKHNVRLGTDFQTRFAPAFRALREVMHNGTIGDIVSMRCQCGPWDGNSGGTTRQAWTVPAKGVLGATEHEWKEVLSMRGSGVMSGSAMFGTDMMRFLMGREVEEVYAYSDVVTAARNQENIVEATLIFQGGIPASYATTNRSPFGDNVTTVYGTKGRASASPLNPTVTSDGVLRVRTAQGETVKEFHGTNMFVDEIEAFNQAIQTGKEANPSGVDGWRERQIVLAVRDSGMKKSVIKLKT